MNSIAQISQGACTYLGAGIPESAIVIAVAITIAIILTFKWGTR